MEEPKSEEQLQEFVNFLEEQARKRTAELERKNLQLHMEVEKRKRLQKKVSELRVQHQKALGEQLHDNLTQHLYATQVVVRNLLEESKGGAKIRVEQLEHLSSCLEAAENDARSLARGLVPVEFEDGDSLLAALKRMTKELSDFWRSTECQVESNGAVILNHGLAGLKLYYIAQEAVNNAFKHAQATQIIVRLQAGNQGEVILEVEDNGLGIRDDDLQEGRGLGIDIMEHRAELIDATLEIKRREEGGTLVRCVLNPR